GLVVGDAATSAGKRERRPDDRRQADVWQRFERFDQALLDVALLAVGLARIPEGVEILQRRLLFLLGKAARLDLFGLHRVRGAVAVLEIGSIGERRFRRLKPDLL